MGRALGSGDYNRPAAFFCAFFSRRGRRDLFLGSSFPTFTDFVAAFGADSLVAAVSFEAVSFFSVVSFCFANVREPPLNCTFFVALAVTRGARSLTIVHRACAITQ